MLQAFVSTVRRYICERVAMDMKVCICSCLALWRKVVFSSDRIPCWFWLEHETMAEHKDLQEDRAKLKNTEINSGIDLVF